MAITNSWHITNLERELSDGYVYTAYWRVTASEPTGQTDGTGQPTFYAASANGAVSLERPSSLIPYSSLTEGIVLGWVKDEIGTERITEIEADLANQIYDQKSPRSSAGVPW